MATTIDLGSTPRWEVGLCEFIHPVFEPARGDSKKTDYAEVY
jgi:hypothetical protein